MKRIRKWLIPIVCGIAVILLFQFVLLMGIVPSSSMAPTIREGSFMIGSRIFGRLNRGDIVVFRRDNQMHVKRIVAVPGDVVYINDGDHSFTVNEPMTTATRILTVPVGCFFVVGDNRADSLDSRYWDNPFVKQEAIEARFLV